MPFLLIGATEIPVDENGARREEDEVIGGTEQRMLDGTLRSTADVVKRRWSFTTEPLSPAAADAILAAITPGVAHACTGDGLPAGGVTCVVRRTGQSPYTRDDLTYEIAHTFSLREA